MLVFGDVESIERPRKALEMLGDQWSRALTLVAGPARHDTLVNVYVEASRIAQGCVDHEFAQRGCDARTPLHEAALQALGACAHVIARSCGDPPPEPARDPFKALLALSPDACVTTRVPEGFAFYALDPQACLEVEPDAQDTCVIGIRSIGMALAPLLAHRLQAGSVITLRPLGPPFERHCAVDPALADELKDLRGLRFAIVDEGPGLSGSSLGAVADLLEALGVHRKRISFYPSHAGEPGPMASAPHRQRWRDARKHPLALDDLGSQVAGWVRDLVGESATPVRDLSGGLWREHVAHHARTPANRPFERRKFLIETDRGRFLAKYVGLGAIGLHKANMARQLAAAGFAPHVMGARRGYLVERWMEGRSVREAPRDRVLVRVADYIAFRADALAPPPFRRTDLARLHHMARHNIAQALGPERAAHMDRWTPRLPHIDRLARPIASDNRMHVWEWLVSPDGAILKTDAVDHHAGHDLVGARDAAWDVAGAIVEFDIKADEQSTFLDSLRERNVSCAPEVLQFHLKAYCAFQLGGALMAADANAAWPCEAERWRAEAAKYQNWLEASAR